MTDPYAEFDAPKPIGDNSLARLVGLANDQMALEQKIAAAEDEVKRLKAEHKTLTEQTIPDFMREIGIKDFTLDNGAKIAIDEVLSFSIPAGRKGAVIDWLREIGEVGIIKSMATIDLGKGKAAEAAAAKVMDFMKELDCSFVIGDVVNTTSFKALVRKRMEQGKPVPPLEEIGGYQANKSTISFK